MHGRVIGLLAPAGRGSGIHGVRGAHGPCDVAALYGTWQFAACLWPPQDGVPRCVYSRAETDADGREWDVLTVEELFGTLCPEMQPRHARNNDMRAGRMFEIRPAVSRPCHNAGGTARPSLCLYIKKES